MLDKVPAPELTAATVENSIKPYAKEHKIPFNELLMQYIKVKLVYYRYYYWMWFVINVL